MKKRIVAILLVLTLCLGIAPAAVASDNSSLDNFQKKREYQKQFTDVPAGAWYEGSVAAAYELGLVNGSSDTTFSPDGNVTIVEALALADRLHSIYHGGTGIFEQGDPWYQVYVDYAHEQGIIAEGTYENLSTPATRAQFATILAAALPEEALPERNLIDDDIIPDLRFSDESLPIYRLYRAGILTGNDDVGTFTPETPIARSAVAAIVTRMADADLRRDVKLHNHVWDEGIETKPAGCLDDGTMTYTCAICGENEERPLPAKGFHTWDTGKVTTESTCTEAGVTTYTCTVCGETRTEAIDSLGHDPDDEGICRRCGIVLPLSLTAKELATSKTIRYLGTTSFNHNDSTKVNTFQFSLEAYQNYTRSYVVVPVIVDIKIINESGVTVYQAQKRVLPKDFNGNVATITIPDSAIEGGDTRRGTAYFTVHNDGFTLSYNRSTYDLPFKAVDIQLPSLPKSINEYGYNDKLYGTTKVTDISYEVVYGDSLKIYFTGEKTYDYRGSGQSASCKVGWKLYDSEGYIVESGTFYSESIKMGEKFRNGYAYAYDCIVPGESYRLEILNVN